MVYQKKNKSKSPHRQGRSKSPNLENGVQKTPRALKDRKLLPPKYSKKDPQKGLATIQTCNESPSRPRLLGKSWHLILETNKQSEKTFK